MKPKLMFLAMFAAVLSLSCVSNSRGVSAGTKEPGASANLFRPITLTRTALVAGGKCLAKLTYDKSGDLISVETDPPCVVGQGPLVVNGQALQDNPDSITFGSGTTTCYGPPIPSPPRCVCTRTPCP